MQCLIHCLKHKHEFHDELINRGVVDIVIKLYNSEQS